jgi:urease accessory protein
MERAMLTLHTKVDQADKIDGEIVLSYGMREKNRLRATLSSGEEVTINTVRGTILRNGDLLKGDDGRVVRILAAKESTYRVECDSLRELLRCAFHLGNRHTQVHIGCVGDYGYLRIRHDPILKEMLEGFGATVIDEHAAFEPEAGANGDESHHHGDGAEHRHPPAPVPVRQKIHRPSDH